MNSAANHVPDGKLCLKLFEHRELYIGQCCDCQNPEKRKGVAGFVVLESSRFLVSF
jgi:hypothetical protein